MPSSRFAQQQSTLRARNRTNISSPPQDQANGHFKPQRLRDLELKVEKTAAERTELTGIKDAIIAAAKEYDLLNKKTGASLTEEERQKLIDYTGLNKESAKTLNVWSQEFDQQFGQIRDQAEREAVDRAQAAAVAVAKKQGFTVLYSSSSVVYAANDITADVTKEANK